MTRATTLAVNDQAVQDFVLNEEATDVQVTELTEVAANKWISLRRLIKALSAFATIDYVRRSMGNFSGQTTLGALPQTLLANTAGRRIVVAGPGVLTLPVWATANSGSKFYIQNIGTGDVTVNRQGDDVVVAFNKTLTSLTIQPSSSAVIARGDTNYVLEEGTSALKYATEFTRLEVGTTVVQRLPGGEVEVMGLYVGSQSGQDVLINLPVTFTAAPHNILAQFADTNTSLAVGSSPPLLQARGSTTNSITIRNLYVNPASFYWRVRGKV
ncbi:hypothetical protein [Pseudomonas viridiflava]|uniref:hypothetical protein n=1 Tax=Pseudomonas viridiflava TaxID=33069 RepID=UPI000F037BEF|nr:hypothetical protein [Pseudomonas viridiflava]